MLVPAVGQVTQMSTLDPLFYINKLSEGYLY